MGEINLSRTEAGTTTTAPQVELAAEPQLLEQTQANAETSSVEKFGLQGDETLLAMLSGDDSQNQGDSTAVVSPEAAAQEFLDTRADDSRRNLTPEQRDTLKQMERAVLGGDVASLERIVQSFDKDRRAGEAVFKALGNDLKDAGIFVNSWESFSANENSGYLALSNFKTGASITLSTAGKPTEATIKGEKSNPDDVLKSMGKSAVEQINTALNSSGAEKLDKDTAALLEGWKKEHSTPKRDTSNTFQSALDETITDNGDGTCTVKGLLNTQKGTVAKDAATGDLTYSYGDGRQVVRTADGRTITKTPAKEFQIGQIKFNDPASTITRYASGLQVTEGNRVRLPDGRMIVEGENGNVTMRDKYGDSSGKVTTLADGSKEYYLDDGNKTITVKPNGEVISRTDRDTTMWAADGAEAHLDDANTLSLRGRFSATETKNSFEAPNGFKAERTADGIRLESSQGVYRFDRDGNLEFTGTDGQTRTFKAADAEKVTYGGGSIVELRYPGGPALTAAGRDIYLSVPSASEGNGRHHFWMTGGQATVYYQVGNGGHYNPNYYPMNAR